MFIADSPSWHQSSFYNLKSIATIGQKAQQLAEQRETVGLSEGGRPSKTGLSKDPVSASLSDAGIDKNLANRNRKALFALADMNFGTLMNYGWVARQVKTSLRNEDPDALRTGIAVKKSAFRGTRVH